MKAKKIVFLLLMLNLFSGNMLGQSIGQQIWGWVQSHPVETQSLIQSAGSYADKKLLESKIKKAHKEIEEMIAYGDLCASVGWEVDEYGNLHYKEYEYFKCREQQAIQEAEVRRQEEAIREAQRQEAARIETQRLETEAWNAAVKKQAEIENFKNVSAGITKIWAEHNVYQNEQKGIKIHLNFAISSMLNGTGQCSAYFYYSDGNPLKDSNNLYCTDDGQVAVGEKFTPLYSITTYTDFALFIPISELHLPNIGQTEFKAYVKLWALSPEGQYVCVANSEYINMLYGNPEN